jgi:hypothetical protein
MPNLAHALQPYMGHAAAPQQTAEAGIVGGVAGSVLNNIFGGRG